MYKLSCAEEGDFTIYGTETYKENVVLYEIIVPDSVDYKIGELSLSRGDLIKEISEMLSCFAKRKENMWPDLAFRPVKITFEFAKIDKFKNYF